MLWGHFVTGEDKAVVERQSDRAVQAAPPPSS